MRRVSLLAVIACAAGPDDKGLEDTSVTGVDSDVLDTRTYLPIEDQAVRVSLTLRGERPTPAELRTVREDPGALERLADRWVEDEGFAVLVRDLYADALAMRSVDHVYPPAPSGPLARATLQQMASAVSEEALDLIAEVVTAERPFTEIVTADWTVLDRTASRMWSNTGFDPDGPDKQVVSYTDGRPAAGVLATNGLWARHRSAGGNHQRGRANAIASALLCADFLAIDVPIPADVDLADDEAVAEAVTTRPACRTCHEALDPLASHLWSFHPEYTPAAVSVAYLTGCKTPFLELCYPFDPYRPPYELARPLLGLPAPGYYGEPSSGLATLGQAIAADPRFADCTVRRQWSQAAQVPLSAVPDAVAEPLVASFVASGFDYKALAKAVAMHPDLRAADASDPDVAARIAGPLVVTPRQQARTIRALTGFSFDVDIDGLRCDVAGLDRFCYGDTDVSTDAVHGFRAMTGGTDGARVLTPVHTFTPVKVLFTQVLAEEAAGFVVARDLGQGPAELLTEVDVATSDEASIRAQLVLLHDRLLAETVAADSAEIDASWTLWRALLDHDGTVRGAWRGTLAAMLQAPRLEVY